MYLIQNLFLLPNFHTFRCTTHVSVGFATHVCRLKHFSALFTMKWLFCESNGQWYRSGDTRSLKVETNLKQV